MCSSYVRADTCTFTAHKYTYEYGQKDVSAQDMNVYRQVLAKIHMHTNTYMRIQEDTNMNMNELHA